jgi:hypothetical protein
LESHDLGVVQQEKCCDRNPGSSVQFWLNLLFVDIRVFDSHLYLGVLAIVTLVSVRSRRYRNGVLVLHEQ